MRQPSTFSSYPPVPVERLADERGVIGVYVGSTSGHSTTGGPAGGIATACLPQRQMSLASQTPPRPISNPSVIRTGRGPHALAVDTQPDTTAGAKDGHALLYVGHFTDSYMGVVDLDMRHPNTFGTMFASVGTPLAPRESK